MSYVTQGTVQIEIKAGSDSVIGINPVQDYSVKREGKTFIIFINCDSKASSPEIVAFDAAQAFTAKDPGLRQALIEAAIQQTKIEITIKDRKPFIESLKIPAT